MKFARHRLNAAEQRRAIVDRARGVAYGEGLAPCGKASSFFQQAGIGSQHRTSLLQKNGSALSKLREQWWAPAELVALNEIMQKEGLSGKVRLRMLRRYMEGGTWPPALENAVARYTERQFQKR